MAESWDNKTREVVKKIPLLTVRCWFGRVSSLARGAAVLEETTERCTLRLKHAHHPTHLRRRPRGRATARKSGTRASSRCALLQSTSKVALRVVVAAEAAWHHCPLLRHVALTLAV